MNESEPEEQKIHEETETLQDIAKDVERVREEQGTSEFEEPADKE
jgi:hypothetical protein